MIKIPGSETFTKIEPIHKGWTNDKKYYIETSDGRKLLLRIADVSEYEHKKAQFSLLKWVSKLDIPMSHPMDLGLCNYGENVYQIFNWVDGEAVDSVLPKISKTKQYHLGLNAGRLLQMIHSIPVTANTEDWGIQFNHMLQDELETHHSQPEMHSDFGETIKEYFKKNRDILGVRSQVYMHGDYNPGNLIITPNGELGVIDFSSSYGDPYWDIFKVSWRPSLFPYYYSGQIRGYFNNEPTLDFWNVYTHYFAYGVLIALRSPQWAGFNNPEEGKSVVQNIIA